MKAASMATRASIAKEYLDGKAKGNGVTLRSLQRDHGYDYRTIGQWVKDYREGRMKVVTGPLRLPRKEVVEVPSKEPVLQGLISLCEEMEWSAEIVLERGRIRAVHIR